MNIRQVLAAMAVIAAMSATVVMAQDASAPAPSASAASASSGSHKGRHAMKFEDRKAKRLAGLEKRAAKIQEQQACAQASTDNASLDKCFPKRGQRKDSAKDSGNWRKHAGKGDAGNADAAMPAAK